MCLICVQISKDLLTVPEAWRNLHEMTDSLEDDHIEEVLDMIWDKIMSEPDKFDENSFIFE